MKHTKILTSLIIVLFGLSILNGQWFGLSAKKKQQFILGPDKTWSLTKINDYYEWRNELRESQRLLDADDQVLRRQFAILNGNKITTQIWNFGSISSPNNHTTDIVWEGLGYGYEFGPLICAEVEVAPNSHLDAYYRVSGTDTTWYVRAISDGLVSLDGETSPDGSQYFGWEPLAYNDQGVPYADPYVDYIPTSNDIDRDGDGRPDSWPIGWYNSNTKDYEWPGALRQGASNSDMESFFTVDDRRNAEFEYYPFPDDSSRRGLGLEIECRYYQWSNPLAEDIIFLIYKVTNKSPKDLNEVVFGMWGDPHVGGWNNWQDDLSFFDRDINMVYCWDSDGQSDKVGKTPGYFGYKFLESPGQPYDGLDNDDDGMTDESQTNGIDDDEDWDSEKHDLGVDGLPNTGDRGEGDLLPTAGDPFDIREPGEPNFEWTDLDESDMVGLTGFASPPFGGNNAPAYDHHIWNNYLQAGNFDSANAENPGDYIFIYNSGPINLPAGEARRFSIALIVGQDRDDLTLNAITAQDIYEKNYQFAKPPEKPRVTAVPGDRKVTLYWDDIAESSIDPISEKKDFEGYVIYRSTDPNFLDQQTITDSYGTKFLFEPLKNASGGSARFDLLDNDYDGLSNIPYANRGVYYDLGDNTGIVHSYVDENLVFNGQVYYYAVASYDHGDDSLQIAPSECSKLITLNPENNEVFLDINTVQVIPRSPSAGYTSGSVDSILLHIDGASTASISLEVINPMAVDDADTFHVTFEENPTRYSVEDLLPVVESIKIIGENFASLSKKHINSSSFMLKSLNGTITYTDSVDYILDYENGKVQAIVGSGLSDGESYNVSYTHYPIFQSKLLDMEESNPVFDGIKIYAKNVELDVNQIDTDWNITSPTNWRHSIGVYSQDGTKYPGDFEIRYFGENVDTSIYFQIPVPFEIWEITKGKEPQKIRFAITEKVPSNLIWEPGDGIVLAPDGTLSNLTWEIKFIIPVGEPNIPPLPGDKFFFWTNRPFTESDVYEFVTTASFIDNSKGKADLDKIVVIPNPYVVTNVLEPIDLQNTLDRGARRIYFDHLPAECTIRIYTINGELVRTLNHQTTIDDGKEFWDLTTKDNFPIAFGIYLFHVDAGKLGEKVGRFAVIK
ncbi:MAG: hypothetical protein HQ509_10940 [Candidatus Marinimicrobia bacterium]|nr:hypothetical protein [Candidatus Neomarinimicrobiota bacterium]